MNSIQSYKNAVRRALRGAGKWHPSLGLLVEGLSAAMLQLDRAMDAMGDLDDITYIEKTAYGKKIVPHPVFAMAEKAQATILRYCKALGIVPEEIIIEEQDDKLTELTRELIGSSNEVVVRPE